MNLLRLSYIITTIIRYGLDEIVLRAFASPWLLRLWLLLMFWRPVRKPRGVRLRSALEHLGPLFVKFGQVLSTRRDVIPADIADELALLQDQVKPQPTNMIKQEIEKSYGQKLEEIFAEFEDQPIGSASVAQVHKAVLPDKTTVAVKVLRPGISAQVRNDLALMRSFAKLMRFAHPEAARLKPVELVREFDKALSQEIDLLHEAANCNQLGRNFRGTKGIKIPVVYWQLCTKQVMVMELCEGIPIDQIDDLKKANVDLEKLARLGIEIFFTQVFRDSFFHADMHPGNIFVSAQGDFIVLDFGIVGSLGDTDLEYLGANFLAFINRDYRQVARMHVEAGWVPANTSIPEFEAAIRAVCEPIFARPLREISFGRLLLQLFQVARHFNLEVQPQLILLQKTLLNIEGLGRELAPDLDLWESAEPFLSKWAKERHSPKRFVKMATEAAPSLASLLPDLPIAARILVKQAKEGQQAAAELEKLRARKQRWQQAAVVLALALAAVTLL